MTTPCPGNPPAPAGTKVWRGAVPPELTQWAMDLRDQVNSYPYGTVWTLEYAGQTVTARKDYHTWTWRGGQLVTGLCIPGITLYAPVGGTVGAGIFPRGLGVDASTLDPVASPDPNAAVFSVYEPPRRSLLAPIALAAGVGTAIYFAWHLLRN